MQVCPYWPEAHRILLHSVIDLADILHFPITRDGTYTNYLNGMYRYRLYTLLLDFCYLNSSSGGKVRSTCLRCWGKNSVENQRVSCCPEFIEGKYIGWIESETKSSEGSRTQQSRSTGAEIAVALPPVSGESETPRLSVLEVRSSAPASLLFALLRDSRMMKLTVRLKESLFFFPQGNGAQRLQGEWGRSSCLRNGTVWTSTLSILHCSSVYNTHHPSNLNMSLSAVYVTLLLKLSMINYLERLCKLLAI